MSFKKQCENSTYSVLEFLKSMDRQKAVVKLITPTRFVVLFFLIHILVCILGYLCPTELRRGASLSCEVTQCFYEGR